MTKANMAQIYQLLLSHYAIVTLEIVNTCDGPPQPVVQLGQLVSSTTSKHIIYLTISVIMLNTYIG